MKSSEIEIYCTSFCNHGHRMVDGKPVDHECYILPPAMLRAEMYGRFEEALNIQRTWTTRRIMKRGVKP